VSNIKKHRAAEVRLAYVNLNGDGKLRDILMKLRKLGSLALGDSTEMPGKKKGRGTRCKYR